jgi:pseudouridine kinase
MEVTHYIDTDYLHQYCNLIRQSRFVVLETNLGIEELQYVIDLCPQGKTEYLIEPVSVEKAKKLRRISGLLDYITPNIAELEVLSQHKIHHPDQLEQICSQLGKHYQNILVTLAEKGVYHYNQIENKGKFYPSPPTQVADATGAGDAFVAGLVCGLFHHHKFEECIRLGIVAAHLTLLSEKTVNEELSFARCLALMQGKAYERISCFFGRSAACQRS